MKFGTFVLLMLLIFPVLQGDTIASRHWKLIGPNGGVVEQIVPDRRNSNLWFLINNGVLYRSTDGAATWRSTSLSYVKQVAIHPVTSTIYVLRKFRIWRSQDNGISFHPTSVSELQYLHKIFLHPQNPHILYGFGGDSTFDLTVSFNGGRSWNVMNNLPFPKEIVGECQPSEYGFDDLLVSPFDPKVLFASGALIVSCPPRGEEESIRLLLQSNNGGAQWKVAEKTWYFFHTDPLYPKKAFAFNSDGLKQLTPQGWTTLSKTAIGELFSVAQHPNELLASSPVDHSKVGIQLLKSKDGGKTWFDLPISLSERLITLQSVDDSLRGLLGGTRGTGLFYRNELENWKQIKVSFEAAPVRQIFRNALSGEIIVGVPECFGCSTRFIYSKSSSDAVWREVGIPSKKFTNLQIAVDPKNSSHLLVESKSSLYVSHNKGKDWKRTFRGDLCCSRPTFDPSNPNFIYTVRDESLLKSIDGGNSWSKLTARVPFVSSVTVDSQNGRILYFVYWNGSQIYKSIDGGATAHSVSNGIKPDCKYCDISVVDLAPLAAKDCYLAVTYDGVIYRTLNGGEQWKLLARAPSAGRQKIHPADATGDHLFLWNDRGILLETINAGKSWKNIADELGPGLQIADMSDPLLSPIYIATNRGVFMEQR